MTFFASPKFFNTKIFIPTFSSEFSGIGLLIQPLIADYTLMLQIDSALFQSVYIFAWSSWAYPDMPFLCARY